MSNELYQPLDDGRVLTFAENQAEEYELFENMASGKMASGKMVKAKKAAAQKMDQEKKQAIKIELAAKQSALLAQPSKNRGGKNSRKKSARTSFVLSENDNDDDNDDASDMPTDIPTDNFSAKPDRVSLKRALRKPGHGLRGKSVRFSESESCGSESFEVFEAFKSDPYGVR